EQTSPSNCHGGINEETGVGLVPRDSNTSARDSASPRLGRTWTQPRRNRRRSRPGILVGSRVSLLLVSTALLCLLPATRRAGSARLRPAAGLGTAAGPSGSGGVVLLSEREGLLSESLVLS